MYNYEREDERRDSYLIIGHGFLIGGIKGGYVVLGSYWLYWSECVHYLSCGNSHGIPVSQVLKNIVSDLVSS